MEIAAIKRLIEQDEKTREAVKKIHQEKFDLTQAIEQEKKELSDDAWKQVNAKVEQTRQQLNEQIAENDQKNREYYKAESDHLQSIYDSNAKQWRQEFVERLTKDPSHTS